jgi:hypothetical protein
MGNAGVTAGAEVLAAYYNPAALGALAAPDAAFTHAAWLGDVAFDYAAVAVPVGGLGTVLLTTTVLNSGDIAVRTVEQPLGTGEQFQVRDLALGVGYGRRLTDRFAAGAQVSLVRESIWHAAFTAVAVNFGVQYRLSDTGPTLGASISNLGSRGRFSGVDLAIDYDPDPDQSGTNSNLPGEALTERFSLPILFRVGVGYPVRVGADSRLTLALDAFQPSDNTESVSLGAEWAYRDLLAVRAGYQNLFQEDAESGLTLGGGLRYGFGGLGVRFDYGWNAFGRLGSAHRLTLGLGF